MTAPSRVMFLFSCCILLSFPFLRLACADEVEDMLAVVVMLTTAPYFLFFCRGFKTVGPFVVMIYRMIMGDLLRFVCIYLVFVMGFSQGKERGSPRCAALSRLTPFRSLSFRDHSLDRVSSAIRRIIIYYFESSRPLYRRNERNLRSASRNPNKRARSRCRLSPLIIEARRGITTRQKCEQDVSSIRRRPLAAAMTTIGRVGVASSVHGFPQ